MTLQQIKYVLEIARCGSMNKAADKLFVSQPTLTTSIRALEEEIGISIFDRTNHGVILTAEGSSFLTGASQFYQQYELFRDSYSEKGWYRKKFGISTQHYTFVVDAFVNLVNKSSTLEYDFSLRETRTQEILNDVDLGKSELGFLYRSDYNSKVIDRLLKEHNLEFHPLYHSEAYVCLSRSHPLAGQKAITFTQLQDYPCLSFEQEELGSTYLAEEILCDRSYQRRITVNDRASMINLIDGVQGYTLCSGVVRDDLNGTDCILIPYKGDDENPNQNMVIGYIQRNGSRLSEIGETFLEQLRDPREKAAD